MKSQAIQGRFKEKVNQLEVLEPSCRKKLQKKSKPRNWFWKQGKSEGSE